jgi:hypothetical protein
LGVSLTHAYGVLIQLVVASAVGVMAYLVFSIIFRIEEVNAIGSFIRRSIGGNKNGHPA